MYFRNAKLWAKVLFQVIRKILCVSNVKATLYPYLICSRKTQLSWRCIRTSPTGADGDSEFVLEETGRFLQG